MRIPLFDFQEDAKAKLIEKIKVSHTLQAMNQGQQIITFSAPTGAGKTLVNIFINAIYLYDGYFTMILNAGNRPLSVENIPLDDIEKAFENDDVGCSSNSQLVADAPPRQNNTMRSSAAASGVRSTDGVVFPFQIEPAAPGLISGIFFAYKSWERADRL